MPQIAGKEVSHEICVISACETLLKDTIMKIQINKIKTNYFSVGSISPLRNGFHQSRKLVDQVGQQPQIDKKNRGETKYS